MKAAVQNTKLKRYTFISSKKNIQGKKPPTNQVWEEKEEENNHESSYSKHKIKETQVSIITEKQSRYTTPTNQG